MKSQDLLGASTRFGNGVIIHYRGRLLFAVGKEAFWKTEDGALTITYTGVGGKLEQGEGFVESTHREAVEELGTEVCLLSAKTTLVYDFDAHTKYFVALHDPVNPAIVYTKTLNERDTLGVCTYLATLNGEPKPSREVPALLLLSEEQLSEDITLTKLLENGALIIEQRPIPRNAVMKPFGTATILRNVSKDEKAILLNQLE